MRLPSRFNATWRIYSARSERPLRRRRDGVGSCNRLKSANAKLSACGQPWARRFSGPWQALRRGRSERTPEVVLIGVHDADGDDVSRGEGLEALVDVEVAVDLRRVA